MTDKEKLALIYRVTTGYTFIGDYIIDTPDETILNESFNIYNQTIRNNRFEDFLPTIQVEAVLIKYKLWTIRFNEETKDLDKSLDECKLALYESFGLPDKHLLKIRRQIELIKKRKAELYRIRHMIDEFTLEGYAEHITDLFIFSKMVLDSNYKPTNLPYCDLNILVNQYKKNIPSMDDLKLIARTDPWRSFWDVNKSPYRIEGDNQKTLSLFSKMYDNVFEHLEKPPEGVISDNDMLDGWFIAMRKKQESEKKNNELIGIKKRYPNASEVFIPVRGINDGVNETTITKFGNSERIVERESLSATEVDGLNDFRGRLIKKRIDEQVKGGIVRPFDIPEIKLDAIFRSKNG